MQAFRENGRADVGARGLRERVRTQGDAGGDANEDAGPSGCLSESGAARREPAAKMMQSTQIVRLRFMGPQQLREMSYEISS